MESSFERMFEVVVQSCLAENNIREYVCFYDKSGILSGGLWIMFKMTPKTNLVILPNSITGDIILAIDIPNNEPLEQVTKNFVLEPHHIVGVAIACTKKPKYIRSYIEQYFLKAKQSKISKAHELIYGIIINNIFGCYLKIENNLTMTEGGVKKLHHC